MNEVNRTHVLAVGLERFQRAELGVVEYAGNSVRALVEAWRGLGVEEEDSVVLLDADATKTAVESRLRRLAKSVKHGDAVIFLYAGRGVECDGRILLLASDSQPDDLEFTALAWDDLQRSLERCRAGKTIAFLDLAEGLAVLAADPVVFVSCAPGETSLASGILQQRLWLLALTQALTGKAKRLKGEIGAEALQSWLSEEVPRLLRKYREGNEVQTPVARGKLDRVSVAELKPDGDQALEPLLRDSRLLGERFGRVRTLGGFQKQRGHREPDRHSPAALKFIRKIGADEVDDHAAQIYERLKESFEYRRTDLERTAGDEAASIRTPDFAVDIWLEQDEDDCASYRLLTEIGSFRNPEAILTEAFDRAFTGICDTLLIELARPFPVADKIDELEADPELAAGLEYDGDESFVLRLPRVRLEVSSDRILLRSVGAGGLVELIRHSWEAMGKLHGSEALLAQNAGKG